MMKNNIILKSFVFIFSNIILFLGLDGFLNFAGLQSINKCILLVQLSLLDNITQMIPPVALK